MIFILSSLSPNIGLSERRATLCSSANGAIEMVAKFTVFCPPSSPTLQVRCELVNEESQWHTEHLDVFE